MPYLILVRHGTSEYNAKGLWAGWDNPDLTPEGKNQAQIAAKTIEDIPIDVGYTSPLIRHKETLEIMKKKLDRQDIPVFVTDTLKERNYGIYTGKNKWEIKKQIGEEEFMKLRRGWNYPIPEGESLKQVYDRAIPYFEQTIKLQVLQGKNIIISASNNVLRSLVKHLENISDEDIMSVEFSPGEVYIYTIDKNGKIINKEVRNKHSNTV